MVKLRRVFRDNGLSLVIAGLFVLSTVGQILAGHAHDADERREHGQALIGLWQYLCTGAFGEAIFENWESEFLQMALYVVLTAVLVQRGSAESKDPDRPATPTATKGVRAHSLSIALFVLFALSFVGHAVTGRASYNDDARLHGSELISVWGYAASSRFWFESFQNWQSEFLSILAIVVLSIWLREKGSPESKAVDAADDETGAQ